MMSSATDTICGICIDEIGPISIEKGDVIQLPCHHEFHADCMIRSIYSRIVTCPLCRHSLDNDFNLRCNLQFLLSLLATPTTKLLPHIFWSFCSILVLVDEKPKSLVKLKPMFMKVIQDLDTFMGLINLQKICPARDYQLPCCHHAVDMDYIIHWLLIRNSSNDNNKSTSRLCPVCDEQLPKDMTFELVVQRFLFALSRRKLSWHIFWLFGRLCYLLVQDPQGHAPVSQVIQEVLLFEKEVTQHC